MFRRIYFWTITVLYLGFSLIFQYPMVLIASLKGRKAANKLARKYAKQFGKTLSKALGKENDVIIKNEKDFKSIQDETVVVVSNHQSNADIIFLLGHFPKDIGFVAKKEMEHWPIISFWMKRIQCVFLDRKNPRKGIKTMKEAIEKVRQGFSIVIFPEGTRSRDGEIGEFKKGSFKLAIETGVKIIPVTIQGNLHPFDKDEKAKMIIDKSISTKNMDKEELKQMSNKVREIILSNT